MMEESHICEFIDGVFPEHGEGRFLLLYRRFFFLNSCLLWSLRRLFVINILLCFVFDLRRIIFNLGGLQLPEARVSTSVCSSRRKLTVSPRPI